MSDRVKYTTYLAGAIEHASKKEMTSWRDEMTARLKCKDLLIYDPVAMESSKVGKPSGSQVEYVRGLKRAGKWSMFFDEMWKIWFGSISQNTDIVNLLTNLRMRKHIDGNRGDEMKYWGDTEAVIRSDFIVIYMPKDVKTVGTIWEQVFAFLFRIPIYLILPDDNKTEANSTLLFGTQISDNGNLRVFYNLNDCIKDIKNRYKLEVYEEREN